MRFLLLVFLALGATERSEAAGIKTKTINAATASALLANGANCSASSFPLGVDASGAVESCSTSISGNAATVTTNANLTGPVTSAGNATTIAGPVPAVAVDLSTVTTALALKANLAGATFTAASGITNAAFTATGAGGNIISGSSITTSGGFFGNGAQLTNLPAGSFAAFVSTYTRYSTTENTTSTAWVTIAGTTVTMTMGGGRAMMHFYCSASAAGDNGCGFGWLVNGAFIDGEDVNVGFTQVVIEDDGGVHHNGSQGTLWGHITEATYTGSTTFVPIYKTNRAGGYQCHINAPGSGNATNGQQVCQVVVVQMGQ